MKTFEFTEEQVSLLKRCVEQKVESLRECNTRHDIDYLRNKYEKDVDEFIAYNKETIGKLETLYNYLNS